MTDENACRMDGCESSVIARSLCPRHYQRWRKHGDPTKKGSRWGDSHPRFLKNLSQIGECTVWTGTLTTSGYGRFSSGGALIQAHRYAWERANGPVPEGAVIDHKCWNRACVNIDHLRLATPAENTRSQGRRRTDNTSGHRGVYWREDRKSWAARVVVNGRQVWKYGFLTRESAAAKARSMRLDHFGEFAGKD